MRASLRLFRPAPNQNIHKNALWQDPVWGYFETHGKMEFLPGEQYNLTDEEKKAVLWRYRVKEVLKKEYLRREYDPHNFKYKQGVVMDPAIFRWYALDMTKLEYFRFTPRTVFGYFGVTLLGFYMLFRICMIPGDIQKEQLLSGEILWWDRQHPTRNITCSGNGWMTPNWGYEPA